MIRFTKMFGSKGEVVQTGSSRPEFYPQDKRLHDLNILGNELLTALEPFKLSPKTFDFVIQPYGIEDRLLWFSKVRLESDSDLVKISQTAIKNPDYEYEDKEQEAVFKSIYQNMENGKAVWYLLSAETICLTRNMCDMKIIRAEAEKPVPYQAFIKEARENRITREEEVRAMAISKRKYLAYEKNYNDVRFLFQTAILRSENDVIDGYIEVGLTNFKKKFLSDCDSFSNEKTFALMLLNDCRYEKQEQYEVIQKLKLWANKEAKIDGNRVIFSYSKNCMSVRVKEQICYIYISKDHFSGSPVFQINGRIFNGMDDLKRIIVNGECFSPAPLWWDEVIAFYKTDSSHN